VIARRQCRGFTLTELMIATALFSTLTAGGLAAFGHAWNAWRSASGEARLNERAQYVFATLEPELQMAGYFGAAQAPQPLESAVIPAPAQACGTDLVRRLDLPVEVTDDWSLPCAPRGGVVAGTQVLILRRVAAQSAAPTAGRAQWLAGSAAPGVLHWNIAPDLAPSSPGIERRDLMLRVYYVSRSADGDAATPALRMKSLSAVAGTPAFIDTEVMPGVENLHIELLPTPAVPQRVAVMLALRSDSAQLRGGAPQRLRLTRHYTLRNASLH
jgi:prepilin-type N-terminal cleavage/methylation domain-containing protein